MNNQQSQLNPEAAAITKALAYTENGGKLDINNPSAGKTGEMKSIFQFEPATWKAYAKQASGDENLPMTPENESLVTYSKVHDWLNKGYTVPQIASMWNAGPGEHEAYSGKFSDGSSSVGVNKKYGVKYDVPGYAKKVEGYVKQFSQSPQQPSTQPQASSSVKPTTQVPVPKPVVNTRNQSDSSPFSKRFPSLKNPVKKVKEEQP